MSLRQAAEQALEALCTCGQQQKEAKEALRQALAQPTWRCPLKKPDCNENCGSYGCGN